MTSTLLFTWNNSTYVEYPIYNSGPGTPENTVTNITTQSVHLESPLNLTTTLLITNTTTTDNNISSVNEVYTFTTINGNTTLGTAQFAVSYSQSASSGTTTQSAALSSSSFFSNGIFSEINGLQAIATYDNITGVRTLSVLPFI